MNDNASKMLPEQRKFKILRIQLETPTRGTLIPTMFCQHLKLFTLFIFLREFIPSFLEENGTQIPNLPQKVKGGGGVAKEANDNAHSFVALSLGWTHFKI